MINKKFFILATSLIFLGTTSGMSVLADTNDTLISESNLSNNLENDFLGANEFNPDNIQIQSATGTHLINVTYTTEKGSSTYLGTVTKSSNTSLEMSVQYNGATIKLGTSKSTSGKFKKYRRNIKVTVKGTKIDNATGRSLGKVSYTSTGLTYIEYVPI